MTELRTTTLAGAALGPAAVACCAWAFACGPALAETYGVIELYTSQGCSSCPPADHVLAGLADDPGIVALTFPVDYWDFLGWKDTFARPEFSERQRKYAAAKGGRPVYTPQAIINGRSEVVGSDETAIRSALDGIRAEGGKLPVSVEARIDGDKIVVTVGAGKPPKGNTAVWIASYRKPTPVTIGRGENAGREVTYVNVVDHWQVLGMWNGTAMTVELPITDIADIDTAGCAVVLQSKHKGKLGPVLGATKVTLEPGPS